VIKIKRIPKETDCLQEKDILNILDAVAIAWLQYYYDVFAHRDCGISKIIGLRECVLYGCIAMHSYRL
jgi:hypothetical protein